METIEDLEILTKPVKKPETKSSLRNGLQENVKTAVIEL